MPTLRHAADAVAIPIPVAPGSGNSTVAAVVATLPLEPLVARSHRSVIPAGGVKLDSLLQAPPKTRRVLCAVVVIDGPLTELDDPPFV
jgi:hypothetical protein